MAAPHVAAAAALIMQANPDLTVTDVRALLLDTVDRRPAFTGIAASGGRLNAGAAVAYALAEPGTPMDADSDGEVDAVDACKVDPGAGGPEGCPIDSDGDGVYDSVDRCPNEVGPSSNQGCKVTVVTPTPTPTQPTTVPDTDGDGFNNTVDACRTEPGAGTLNGCPLPAVTALSAKARKKHGKRSATITVRTSRVATVTITVQRKRGRRWVRVTRKALAAPGQRATLKVSRLRKGSYRAVVVVSSAAGRAHAVTKRFRVR